METNGNNEVRSPQGGPAGSAATPITFSDIRPARILVPVDFSEGSRRALECAIGFARAFQAELILLHVFQPPVPQLTVLESSFGDSTFRDEAAGTLQEWQKAVARVGCSVRTVFSEGVATGSRILDTAAEEKVDLIVLGRSPRSALDKLILGNTVPKVIKHAHCPVLVAS